MNRRGFILKGIAACFAASTAPAIFVPKLVKPVWKVRPGYRLLSDEMPFIPQEFAGKWTFRTTGPGLIMAETIFAWKSNATLVEHDFELREEGAV